MEGNRDTARLYVQEGKFSHSGRKWKIFKTRTKRKGRRSTHAQHSISGFENELP